MTSWSTKKKRSTNGSPLFSLTIPLQRKFQVSSVIIGKKLKKVKRWPSCSLNHLLQRSAQNRSLVNVHDQTICIISWQHSNRKGSRYPPPEDALGSCVGLNTWDIYYFPILSVRYSSVRTRTQLKKKKLRIFHSCFVLCAVMKKKIQLMVSFVRLFGVR